jgi:ABC-type transport system involved in cytochrome c biogenesis ATPase subunit
METEILKMVSAGGSVVVLFASIIIFLKELGKRDEVIKALQVQSNAIFTEMRLAHTAQVNAMITQSSEQQKYFQEQFRKVMDEHLSVSKDMTTEFKTLRAEISSHNPRS